MGYGSVILAISGALIAGVLLLSMSSAVDDADAEVNEYHHDELARDAAVTGQELTVRKLAASVAGGSWTNGPALSFQTTPFHSGTFRVEVIPKDPDPDGNPGTPPLICPPDPCSGDTVDVISRGFNGEGRQVLFARYAREYADGGIPPAFRNVITTDFFIQLQGNVDVRSIRSDQNANIHTNEDLITNGNSFLVEGYGTYSGQSLTNQEDNFVPNVDVNGDSPNVFWAPPIDIPSIDLNALRTQAQTSGAVIPLGTGAPVVIDGLTTPMPGVIDFTNPATWPFRDGNDVPLYLAAACTVPGGCGTKDNPFIMVVEDPLDFVHRTEFRGYGVIVSAQDLSIKPQGSGGGVFGQLTDDKQETKLLLATKTNLSIGQGGGTTCVGLGPQNGSENQHCQSANGEFTHGATLYAETNILFRGTPYIVGGIIGKNSSFDDGGTPTIYWGAPTEEITDPGFEFIIPIGPILISYSEW